MCRCACIEDINGDGCFHDYTDIEGKIVYVCGIFEGFEEYHQLSFTVEYPADPGINNWMRIDE